MRKAMLFLLFLLCGCQSSGEQLANDRYDEVSLKQFEQAESLKVYHGKYFDAKLVTLDRYVNEKDEVFYEYRVFVKPLTEIGGKNLEVQIMPNPLQKNYYSADSMQRIFQSMYYPIERSADQYECIELDYHIGSDGFEEISQTKWETAMNKVEIKLQFGTTKEIIKFAYDADNTYSCDEANTTGILYYGTIRDE